MTTFDTMTQRLRSLQQQADDHRRDCAEFLSRHRVGVERGPDGEIVDDELEAKLLALQTENRSHLDWLVRELRHRQSNVARAIQQWIGGIGQR